MPDYTLTFSKSAERDLEHLDPPLVSRILKKIEGLSHEPRPHGCRKIVGARDLWRIRVGDYRVIYSVSDHARTVDVIAVRHRREAYD